RPRPAAIRSALGASPSNGARAPSPAAAGRPRPAAMRSALGTSPSPSGRRACRERPRAKRGGVEGWRVAPGEGALATAYITAYGSAAIHDNPGDLFVYT